MKAQYNLHQVNIPECYDNFPDSFLLDTRDVAQMIGAKHINSTNGILIKEGVVSCCKNIRSQMSKGTKNLYKLGDIRALRDKRNKQLEES